MDVEFKFTIKNTTLEHARRLWDIILHVLVLTGLTVADGGGYHQKRG